MKFDYLTDGLRSHKAILILNTLAMTAVLLIDSQTAVGMADYIFYFVPVALTVLGTNPSFPILTALAATLVTIVGYLLSPPGVDPFIGIFNRSLSVVVMWAVAFFVRSVISTRNQVARATWLRQGLTLLAEGIRGDLSVDQLASNAVAVIAKYSTAPAAVFYVVRPGTLSLDRVSSFGVLFDTLQTPEKIAWGEGHIGEAARTGNPYVVSKVTSGPSLVVSTGLVNAKVQSTVVFPIKANDEVVGVLELGFLGEYDSAVNDLLEQVSEAFGIGIVTAQNRERLAELLAESQQQAEELQAQQEELRVVNEELEQQARALKESQVRLENQQAELEQSNQQLEEQAQALEVQKASIEDRNQELLIAQRQLQKKSDDLQRASVYKSEFLANMSHELRTPLNSSLILAKLLMDNRQGNLDREQIGYAEAIYSSGNDLLTLINDILDLSKVEAGKLDVQADAVPLKSLLSGIEKSFRPISNEKQIDFEINFEGNPDQIFTDRLRLEQILRNLLSNAFKFTSKGKVELKVFSTSGERIAFAVRDTGIGIRADQYEHIFGAFQQADGTTSRKYGGTGLGLSISRELARLLGGNIEVESTIGVGAKFTLDIPQTYREQAVVVKPTPVVSARSVHIETKPEKVNESRRNQFAFSDDRTQSSESKRRLLIIEDDESFAKILYELAREMGFYALVAGTAAEGLELIETHLPHAILLDVRLPDYSGLTVLEHVKSAAKTRHIPVHVVSAEDFSTTALSMGAVGYMLKPVKRDQLASALESLTARMNQELGRVLVLEDDTKQREAIVALINDSHTEITAVSTAEEALAELAKQTFDCMIMDLRLPDLTGFELLEKLTAADSPYSYPPVIVYTGHDLSREEEEKLMRYSQSIIIKGAKSPERLLSEVTLFLHKVESTLPPERQKMLIDLRNRDSDLEDRKIMIVDDDVRNIFALSAALEPQGVLVEIARNGKEALTKLESGKLPDLILMDIMMPEMDGYEATRRIRADKKLQKVPIIAVTAKAMRDDQQKCLEAGANDYLAKPIDVEKLLSLIRVWMPPRRGL